MSCSRFQFELSQCLDGRLSSTRRGEVMAHADACAVCARVWEEMQAAQSAVFRLAEPRVAASFRDAVWDRVRAGEGSPEVLLTSPVTAATKLRYGLVGAVAAALVLLATNLWFKTDTPVRLSDGDRTADRTRSLGFPHQSTDAADPVDAADAADPADPTDPADPADPTDPTVAKRDADKSAVARNEPTPNSTANPTYPGLAAMQLTAANLANHTISEIKYAARRLRHTRNTVLQDPAKTPAPVWDRIRNDVRTLGYGLDFLGTLERENLVEFRGPARYCMQQARVALVYPGTEAPGTEAKVKRLPRTSIVSLVKSLDGCSLEGLDVGLRFLPRAVEFDERILLRKDIQPIIMRMGFRLTMSPTDFSHSYGPGHFQVLLFTNEPPPVDVPGPSPRSQVRASIQGSTTRRRGPR